MFPNLTFFKQNHTVLRVLLPFFIPFLTSCEKVLDIKLKDSESRIVIEGNLSDQPGPYTVKLSRSVGFNDPNVFPAITNATVIISDNTGNIDTLAEAEPGTYLTKTLQGVPGRNYFLRVIIDNQQFDAVSGMPAPVTILDIRVEKFRFNEKEKAVVINFQDPAGIKNYYRAFYIVNGKASDQLLYLSDEFQDGNLLDGDFFDNDMLLKSGDSVKIVLQTINEQMFNYIREQDQLGNSQISSPANPTSNISNNALGYFSAHAETSASIVVP
ncbi:DUF4249 domain-containing protein [Adhaeribacter terreus]|uniref:DUF4249 domain-containing protein n=1 Tax=Adhaeribacter terreus TaxID=529703 RepID=A0ABW0EB78_9BACT